jgi:subtilase family serine protease
MAQLRILPLAILGSVLFASTAAFAQQAAPRITAQVDETSLATLKGSFSMAARVEFDQGEADASTQLSGVRLVFSRTDAQQAALDAYLAELQDPASSNYHKWLTPEQFGKLYGPADSDISAMTAWLQSHGLTVSAVAPGRTGLSFSGSVSQLEEAFHTSIHSFAVGGHQFYANTTAPKIPSALTGVVAGVAHLNTIRPRPFLQQGQAGRFNADSKRFEPLSASATPDLTYTSGTTNYLYMVPGDAATIYDTPNSTLNANYSGTNYTGSGVIIGIGGDAAISTTPVSNYRSKFIGDSALPTITTVTSAQNSSDADEAYLDIELAGGMAPGATIHYYMDDNYLGIEQMLSDNAVDIFSLSFGECELDMSTADNKDFNNWWQQAAAQGITVVVATGDSGSAGCDATKTSSGSYVTTASGGLAVSGFASTPYNIAVGGTDFYSLESSFTTYVSTSSSSSTYYRSALKYIPEYAWNDSSEYDTTLSANVPWTAVSGYTSYASIVAGSGGKSSCSTNTSTDNSNGSVTAGSCTSGYSKPSWQTGTGVPADGVRDLPDVSLLAGDGLRGATWLVCTNDTSNGETTNCATSNGYFYFTGYGGTSTAAPSFAGILALVVQKTGGRLGQADSELYSLFNTYYGTSTPVFHDIAAGYGNNAVPCTSSSTNCSKNSAGYYFEANYDTTAGYDLATGLGSVDAKQLLTYWSSSSSTATFTIAASPSTASISKGSSTSTTVTLTNSGSYSGTVKITCVVSSSVASPTDIPTCSVGTSSITLGTSGTSTITVSTTAASSELTRPQPAGKGPGWLGAGSGAVLALIFLCGIPARRRSWRNLVGVLVLLTVLGGLSACGSGTTSTGTGGSGGNSGTSSGTYVITIVGAGNDTNTTTKEATFTVTVS